MAFEVAKALDAPLDVVVVRKLGVPIQPELAMGALGEEGVLVLNQELVRALAIGRDELEAVVAREQAELVRRQRLYRGDRPPVTVTGRTVILVDDGIATGQHRAGRGAGAAGARRKARGARRSRRPPGRRESRFGSEVDEFVCLHAPEWFFAVGACYELFGQTSDEEVGELLERAHAGTAPSGRAGPAADPPRAGGGIDWSQVTHRSVTIPADPSCCRATCACRRRPPDS